MKNVKKMKSCAYCERTDIKITKEHVVNKAFIKRYYEIGVGYAEVYKKITNNYLTTTDVCTICNNESLSELDDYFLEFYDKNLPKSIIKEDSKFEINYHYNKLSKWILKTLYNSERKNDNSKVRKILYKYKDYIISKEKINNTFKIYLEILTDIPKSKTTKSTFLPKSFNGKLDFLKMGTIFIDNESQIITKYFLSSNFVFHIFIHVSDKVNENAFNDHINKYKFNLTTNNIFYINPIKKKLKVIASRRTILDYLSITIEGDKLFTDKEI